MYLISFENIAEGKDTGSESLRPVLLCECG